MASGDLRRWLTLLPDSRQRRTLAVRRDRRNSSRSDPCVICERAIIVVEFGFHDASPGKTEGADVAAPRGSEGNVIVVFSRSEEHTSDLQSLMRISYAVFCLKKKKQ